MMLGGGIFYCVIIAVIFGAYASNNKWIAPDAWGLSESSRIHDSPVCTGCLQNAVCSSTDSNVASIFYSKFIKFIFNRMKYDDTSDTYSRTIIFKITSTQLDRLEKLTDPRDWDTVLAEVLPKTEFPEQIIQNDFIANIFTSTKSYIKNITYLLISSETRFTLIMVTSVLLIMYINRKYKYGLICTAVAACFLFGLIYSYYECNRELELRELADITNNNVDPCADSKQQDEGFWSWFKGKPSKRHCIEHFIIKHKIKLPFCKPEDVLLKYFHNIIFDQIFLMVEKSTVIFQKIFEKIPFPYNLVAVLIFSLTIPKFIALIFKYILSPTVWRTIGNASTESRDQISGENLKILLESVKSRNENVSGLLESVKRRNENASGIQIIQSVPSVLTIDLTLKENENFEEIVDATKMESEKNVKLKTK